MLVFYTSAAKKDLARLSREVCKRILNKVDDYADTPDPLVFAKRLHGDIEATYRFHIGDWRVKFEAESNLLIVKRVRHRSRAY